MTIHFQVSGQVCAFTTAVWFPSRSALIAYPAPPPLVPSLPAADLSRSHFSSHSLRHANTLLPPTWREKELLLALPLCVKCRNISKAGL
ncbi:unnamed protein product [Protopolystoma xenopodis]|uniref:Uncharacterized protein n=1 Tax=Protopolystoma xenopodis TaxID=117903 RepID=A0A3S5CDN9_9PLAT|nr:unnamed protein product [Protopolystoma xenopodis]